MKSGVPRRASALADNLSAATGLTPRAAAALAYLAGPLSGGLMLIVEPADRTVRFHAWQAVVGLGTLAAAAVTFLGVAFLMVLVSPRAFWGLLWLAAFSATAYVVCWLVCVVRAWRGQEWVLPIAGRHAERLAGRAATSPPAPAAL